MKPSTIFQKFSKLIDSIFSSKRKQTHYIYPNNRYCDNFENCLHFWDNYFKSI